MCLAAANNKDGAAVELKKCSSAAASSKWAVSNGNLIVYGNKCLDVTGGSTANGVKMQVYTCGSRNPNQQFTITADKRIAWTGKGECLDLTGGSIATGNVVSCSCVCGERCGSWDLDRLKCGNVSIMIRTKYGILFEASRDKLRLGPCYSRFNNIYCILFCLLCCNFTSESSFVYESMKVASEL